MQEPFRITKACLEMSTAGESVSSLMIECDNNEEFIIANLSSTVFNETLDLAFNEGEKICFKVKISTMLAEHYKRQRFEPNYRDT